jgi:hypothetical protein
MLPHFLLISRDNVAEILGYNGVIQLGIIAMAIIVVMLALLKFKAGEFYKTTLFRSPFKAGIIVAIFPAILFFLIVFIFGEAYGYF